MCIHITFMHLFSCIVYMLLYIFISVFIYIYTPIIYMHTHFSIYLYIYMYIYTRSASAIHQAVEQKSLTTCRGKRLAVDDANPAWPNKNHITIIPGGLVSNVLQDIYHQRYQAAIDTGLWWVLSQLRPSEELAAWLLLTESPTRLICMNLVHSLVARAVQSLDKKIDR